MARLTLAALVVLALSLPASVRSEEGKISPGVITANNVEITTDTGEVLDQRLAVGDPIYIIRGDKKKKGWERISRTPNDAIGIGWVEAKYVMSFQKWEAPTQEQKPTQAELTGEKTVIAPDVEPAKAGQVGVLPFLAADPDDPIAKWAYDAFGVALKNTGKIQIALEALKSEKVNPEAPESVQALIKKYNLDGLFIGSISGDMGESRLLQIRYFGKGREGAVLEKVKKIPKEGNLKPIIDQLAASCVSAISSK